MHVPDGFLDVPTSAATAVVAATAVGVALRRARAELDDRTAPMAGLVAAFVFAGQMVNFPVGAGTSGHLIGGALAAVLVGPWTAMLCLSVVLLVQALFMADGGVTALGTNITLMGVVGCFVGYAVFLLARRVLPRRIGSVAPAAAVGALVSVPVAAGAFTLLFALGGTAPIDVSAVLTAMLTWHLVIGVGEAAITALVISAVVAVRPDLVYGARGLRTDPRLEIRRATGLGAGSTESRRPMSTRRFVLAAVAVILLVAGGASYYASSHPDGLIFVAQDQGFSSTQQDSATADSPLAGYETRGVGDARLSKALAGVAGALAVLGLGGGLFWVVRRREPDDVEH